MNKIELTTHINAPIDRCFDLARSIELHKLSLKQANEQILGGVRSGLLGPNQRVLWQANYLGMRQSMELKLTNLSAPYYFTFETVSEIIPNLIHDHFFYDIGEETVMIEHFYYKTPLGLLGETANVLFLKRYLTSLLRQRAAMIREHAETEKWRNLLPEQKEELSIVC